VFFLFFFGGVCFFGVCGLIFLVVVVCCNVWCVMWYVVCFVDGVVSVLCSGVVIFGSCCG
jgi:hypothetical protein